MSKYEVSEYQKLRPVVNIVPLIDILIFAVIFLMSFSLFNQQETEINISVPQAKEATQSARSPGEIIINITKAGQFIVNQKSLNQEELETMLMRVSTLFPDQSIIIRADESSIHKYVINALDACAKANIWNISFATQNEKQDDEK
ncbi:MAG: biopolymer transporter ExbD [Candidatus Omnitrophica bacterium]|nr:biopolymer transporter ExbD [Candidatus Omnitrophota bacterium]